ncbi:MAG: RNA methyltransferase [Lewinellaceae bacterium]|nr:RNA methyltransferase [Saprospiraceae bacterium]MCB9330830.1 RNA methyltransferase [Lewinellaceae bacterium]
MLSASQQKFLTALQVKKYRQKYRNFTVEGSKLVTELLMQKRISVVSVFGLERWATENAASLAPFYQLFNAVSEADLKKVSALKNPPPVLAVAELPEPAQPALDSGVAFYLDGIRDPGNLGTIIRVADWFGMPAVYCSPDCVDAFGPKVVQASMGAVLRIPLPEMELTEILHLEPQLPVAGAVLDGDNVFTTQMPDHGLLVIGNEGSGIRPNVEALLTRRLTIPRAPGSAAESLNASVAAGILAAFVAAVSPPR